MDDQTLDALQTEVDFYRVMYSYLRNYTYEVLSYLLFCTTRQQYGENIIYLNYRQL